MSNGKLGAEPLIQHQSVFSVRLSFEYADTGYGAQGRNTARFNKSQGKLRARKSRAPRKAKGKIS